MIFFTRPVAAPIMIVALVLIFMPLVKLLRRGKSKRSVAG
jgi:putative tricarboxylic transport membrane protein